MSSTQTNWQLAPRARLTWRRWGESAVVFNAASGDTHSLNLLERTALACVEDRQPVSAGELARRVAEELEIDADEALVRYLDALLAQFDEVGLVVPAPPCRS